MANAHYASPCHASRRSTGPEDLLAQDACPVRITDRSSTIPAARAVSTVATTHSSAETATSSAEAASITCPRTSNVGPSSAITSA